MTWDIYYKKLEEKLSASLGAIDDLQLQLEDAIARIADLEERMGNDLGSCSEAEMRLDNIEAET